MSALSVRPFSAPVRLAPARPSSARLRAAALLLLCLFLTLFAPARPARAQPPAYALIGLGNMGHDAAGNSTSVAVGLNASGQVAGLSDVYDAAGKFLGTDTFLWSNGKMTDLGNLGTDAGGVGYSTPAGSPGYGTLDAGTSSVGAAGRDIAGNYSASFCLNASGQVVGSSALHGAIFDAQGHDGFLWSGGQMLDLGSTGTDYRGKLSSDAVAINDAGQYLLNSAAPTPYQGNLSTHSLLVSGGVRTDLGGLSTDGQGRWGTQAAALNASGQAVGASELYDAAGNWRGYDAFLWSGGKMTDLGNLGTDIYGIAQSNATGINAAGQVIGYSVAYTADHRFEGTHAFLYTGGRMVDLGDFGGDGPLNSVVGGASYPTAINASGQVVGSSAIFSGESILRSDAFLYSGGQMTDLGNPEGSNGSDGSAAVDINDAGQVVGTYASSLHMSGDHPTNRAFLYSGGRMLDLNTLIPPGSGWTLQEASAINNNGQIAGTGLDPRGYPQAFLLTPVGSHVYTWTALGVSCGADGSARALWARDDGTAAFWKLGASGTLLANAHYGPYPGWTIKSLAACPDGGARALWTRADGTASFWRLDSANNYAGQQQYGPFYGWTAKSLAAAPDGTLRALWLNQSGAVTVWTLDSGNHYASQQQFGPYPGWTARSLSVGRGGEGRLLWARADGRAAFWKLDAHSQLVGQQQYGPYYGWSAQSVASAPDGTGRVSWVNSDGHVSLWTIDAGNTYTGQSQYGPYAGWSLQGLAVGADGDARLLWDNASREAALWSLTPSGAFARNDHYGPY